MRKKSGLVFAFLGFLFLRALPARAAVNGTATFGDLGKVVENILKQALPLLGLAAGIMIVIGGFQLITAGGSREGAQKAKNTFSFAIFGLILAIIAWFILTLIRDFTGVNVTEFAIPTPMP